MLEYNCSNMDSITLPFHQYTEHHNKISTRISLFLYSS
uniref:Uncharacterized protein n=1 Tax=Anguilla anguilla TaxID=7936 RepID=A0A0E9QQ44_ANGAN